MRQDVGELISLPNQIQPYEKRHIRTNAPFFITLLISSFQSNYLHLLGKEINSHEAERNAVFAGDVDGRAVAIGMSSG